MLKATVIAALLAAAGATAASAQDYRAQSGYGYGHHNGYGQGGGSWGSDGGLGRYCPPGYYPHSFPSGSGIRCTSVGDDVQFDPGHH